MSTRHKMVASDLFKFEQMLGKMMENFEQCGEKVCKIRISWDDDSYKGYRAKIWTRREGAREDRK